jgi:peptidoglycan/LPS O-acetylase OafA/YrhL
MKDSMRALPSLEGLRFLASLMIVANHYLEYLNIPTEAVNLAVDLFFVISGIVIAMNYQGRISDFGSYFDFVRKRIARLYPLHIATLLFYVALGLVIATGKVTPENAEKYNPSQILPNLLMVHAWFPNGEISYNYVSWSISAEFFVYLCFPPILFAVARQTLTGLAICVLLLTATAAVSESVIGWPLPMLNWVSGALRAIPSFAFGVWLWHNKTLLAGSKKVVRFAPAVLAGAMVTLLALMAIHANVYLMLGAVYVVGTAAFLSDINARNTLASWAPVSSRGYLTYSIYMLHTVMATIVISFIFPALFGKSPGAVAASILVAIAATYIASVISYRYFESPLRAWINTRTITSASTPATPLTLGQTGLTQLAKPDAASGQ